MIDHRLHVLRMLSARGTVAATAEALHYTPSAVSAQLRSLSDELGVALLVPQGRRLKLTNAGTVLLRRSHELFELWEDIAGDVQRSSEQISGTLRLCGFSTASAVLLPGAVKLISQALPNAQVKIIEAEPEECFELLLNNEVDVAVFIPTTNVPARSDIRFEQESLLRDPLDLLVPQSHRLANRESVALDEFGDEAWIVDRPGTAYHQLFFAACASIGLVPTIAHHATEWDSATAMVGEGMGVALVPRLARLPEGSPVTRLPIHGEPRPDRHILTGIRRGSRSNPLIAQALIALHEVAGNVPHASRTSCHSCAADPRPLSDTHF